MKHIEKKKFTKKQKLSLILCAVFAVLLAVCIPVGAVLTDKEEEKTVTKQPEIIEGEARQNGLALAYPVVNDKNQIQYISIKNEKGEYELFEHEMLESPKAAPKARAFVFERNGKRMIACWHTCGKGILNVDLGCGVKPVELGDLRYLTTDLSVAEVKAAWAAATEK